VPNDVEFLFDGPKGGRVTIALAHGAGVSMDCPFMEFFAKGLGWRGHRVVRFEFPYMSSQRSTGKKKPPDREPVLRETWLKVIEALGRDGLIIGGKSMGGRIASLIADEIGVSKLICLGYPFHPVDQPERLRVEHIQSLKTPTLIVQGERDPFGNRDEVAAYRLSPAIEIAWIEDGDHSFEPRKSSGRTMEQNWDAALEKIAAFVG
jgi:predicted alpha/beta-hydrolase family hydrolase